MAETDNKGYTVRITTETGTIYDETITGTIPESDTAIVKFDNIPTLPGAGGVGTTMFRVLGLLLIMASIWLMLLARNSKIRL